MIWLKQAVRMNDCYAFAKVIWLLRQKLSVGLKGLYGFMQARNGADADHPWPVQLGMDY